MPESTARLVERASAAGRARDRRRHDRRPRARVRRPATDGTRAAGAGWTDLVITPERPVRAVDGLLTGLHDPESSHLHLLEAIAGPELVERSYDAAARAGYLRHEFGDLELLLP